MGLTLEALTHEMLGVAISSIVDVSCAFLGFYGKQGSLTPFMGKGTCPLPRHAKRAVITALASCPSSDIFILQT